MNEKNAIQTPWTLYSKLTGPQAFSNVSGLSLTDKLEVYFQDFSIMPLFVQENYLKGRFSRAGGAGGSGGGGPEAQLKNLDLACKAAESISDGDLVDAMIHGCACRARRVLVAVSLAIRGLTLVWRFDAQHAAAVESHAAARHALVCAPGVVHLRSGRRIP